MVRMLVALLALAMPAALAAQDAPRVTLDQRMLLRCSATFALVADRQQRGEAWALEYPALGEAGREFFVRASAKVMDETGMTRDQVAERLRTEAQDIWQTQAIAQMMPVCLPLITVPGGG